MQQQMKSVNGHDLFTIANNLDSDKSILLVHGYAEHIVRYEGFIKQLTSAGFRVMGYDHKGHGQSTGKRAIIGSFDDYVEDLARIIDDFFVEGENNFLYGHSMGGLVSLMYVQKYGQGKLSGLITTGAAMKTYEETAFLLKLVAPIIAAVWPSFPAAKIDGSTVSRDPEEVRKYNEDPLNYRKMTKAKLGHEFLKAQIKGIDELPKVDLPIMINHGSKDQLIHPESAQIVFNGISSTDKELKIWDGLYHELLNEPEKVEVGEALINWALARCK